MGTASGLNDYDYQNLSNLTMGLKNLNQLELVSKIPIPPEIMEHFRSNFVFSVVKLTEPEIYCFVYLYFIAIDIKCHCMMGLFSEIGRAWLTIDSDIYVSSSNFCVKKKCKFLLFY